MKSVDKQMEDARKLSRGTMPIYVAFDTQEEIDAAHAWVKGKQKTKLIAIGFPHPSSFPLDESLGNE